MACNNRLLLLNVYVFEVILTIWRQTFDFLGYMWGPILMNFFHIIFTIFGAFGVWQYKASYLLSYSIWAVLWCAWNLFVLCFYLNLGILDRDTDVLSLWTGGVSWWEANGPGCKVFFLPNQTSLENPEPWKPIRPDLITGCILPFQYVESTQAILHFLLSAISICFSFSIYKRILDGDKQPFTVPPAKAPLYPPEIIPRRNTMSTGGSEKPLTELSDEARGSKPMTPRRVKRRSISKGHPPPYGHQGSASGGTLSRSEFERTSSRRHSRNYRRHHNPLNKIIQQQEGALIRGHTNLMFQHSPENSFDEERPASARSSYSNYHGTRAHSYRQSHTFLSSGPPGYSSQSETAI